ncbi:MAG: hypothetical protein AB7P07_09160 [Hyphomonadaceae bacterium]
MPLTRRALLCAAATPILTAPAWAQQPAARTISYADFDRYLEASTAIDAGAEPVAALQAYLDAASPGLQTWLGIYPFTAEQLAAQRARRPNYYRSLATLRARLPALEPELLHAYAALEALHPGASLGDIYFLVGRHTAGGTARGLGAMTAVEFFGRTPQTDMNEFGDNSTLYGENELLQVVIHEGVHNLQRQIQTEPNFIGIYVDPTRMTLLNFAVREGVADYVTHIVSGRVLPRNAILDPIEAQVWAEFQQQMQATIMEAPGWFQGAFADGRNWPNQPGYYVGYKMAEHIHAHAADQNSALMEILSPHTDAQFAAIAARYAEKFAG